MQFKQPYFIPTHTVQRFRERVADIPRDKILHELQKALQTATPELAKLYDGHLAIIYSAECMGKEIFAPVLYNNEEEWPIVLTVQTDWQKAAKKIKKAKPKRTPWTAQEDTLLKLLREKGFTILQCAKLMQRAHTTIERHLETKVPRRRWTEAEKEKAIKLRALGRTYGQIAKRLDRTQNAVEIFFCRYRKEVMSDPEKVKVLKALSFCLNPSRVLRYLRDTDIIRKMEEV